MAHRDHIPKATDKGELEQFVEIEQACTKAVVDVMIVVGDIVRDRRELGFKAGPAFKFEVPFCVCLRQRPGRRPIGPLCLARPSRASKLKLRPAKSG